MIDVKIRYVKFCGRSIVDSNYIIFGCDYFAKLCFFIFLCQLESIAANCCCKLCFIIDLCTGSLVKKKTTNNLVHAKKASALLHVAYKLHDV